MTIYRGKIKSFTPKGVMLQVPALASDKLFGPCGVVNSGSYEIEQDVLVTNLNGVKEDIVVLGPTTVETYEDIVDGGELGGAIEDSGIGCWENDHSGAIDVVRDCGAVGDGVTDDTEAFQKAIDVATAHVDSSDGNIIKGGSTIVIPRAKSHYIIKGSLRFANNSRSHIRMVNLGGSYIKATNDSTEPLVTISNNGTGRNGRIIFENVFFAGAPQWNQSAITNRIGVLVDQAQDLEFHNTWIFNFKYGGLVAKDMWDSMIYGLQVMRCGYGNSDTDYAYAVQLLGNVNQSNANKFTDCHFENNALDLLIDDDSRSNTFTACKFERNALTESTSLGNIWLKQPLENTFQGCFFSQDTTISKKFIDATGNDSSYGASTHVQRYTSFIGCQFTAPSGVMTQWVKGNHVVIDSSTFSRCNGTPIDCVFDFGPHVRFTNNQVSLADKNINMFRIAGEDILIKNNSLNQLSGSSTTGALIRFQGQYDGVVWEDNYTNGAFDIPLTLDFTPPSLTWLGNGRYTTPVYQSKTITSGSTTSVFDVAFLTLKYSSATTLTYLNHGYNGQRITIRASNSNATIAYNSSSFVLKGGSTRALASGDIVNMLCIAGGVWVEF